MPARPFIEMVWTPLPTVMAGIYFEMADKARELVEPVQEIVDIFASEIEENFESEGRPTRWQELAEGTVAQKGGEPILQRTGELRNRAISADTWSIGQRGQEVFAVLDDPTGYGVFHVTGTSKGMPARDWTYISDDKLQEAEDIIFDWVTEPWEQ